VKNSAGDENVSGENYSAPELIIEHDVPAAIARILRSYETPALYCRIDPEVAGLFLFI
jgi:hypothetical protein